MASVFKQSGKGKSWYAKWKDHNGRWQRKCTFTTDKAAAKRIAAKQESEAALRRDGDVDASQDRQREESRRAIGVHLGDYKATLIAKNRAADYVTQNDARARAVVAACNAAVVSDLTQSTVEKAIGDMKESGKSLATCNSYLRSIKGFTRWLAEDRRINSDPLAFMELYNEETDRRLVRRVLSHEELEAIYAAAAQFIGPRHAIRGLDRVMLYRVAAGTGFRAGELRSLTPESFSLESSEPTITVAATHSKRRRTDVQPISLELANRLKEWLKDKPGGKPVFVNMPVHHTARMLRRDLARARKTWIDEAKDDKPEQKRRQKSDYLCYRNAAGHVADFHATRHTFVSNVVASGATVKEAQELSRHLSPMLTIGRYAHVQRRNLQRVVESLPGTTRDHHRDHGTRETARLGANSGGDSPLRHQNSKTKNSTKNQPKRDISKAFNEAEGTGLE